MNPDHKVYDDHDDKPVTRPDLRHLEGRSQAPKSGSARLGEAATGGLSQGGDSGESNSAGDESGSAINKGLSAAEAAASGGLYKGSGGNGSRYKRRIAGINRKKALIGGGTAAGIATIIAGGFLLLIPLKIEHMVTNLQNRFTASSEEAVQTETQNLFEKYMVQKVLPAYKDCGTTIDRHCSPRSFGTGPVENLYRTWADARLENKLAENHGIEFSHQPGSKTWYLKAPGLDPGGVNIGSDGSDLGQQFNKRSDARKAFRTAFNASMENETKWKKVMYRYKYGRLLEAKYGIKRCIMFCGTQDALADKKDAKKISAQLYIVQRVITPHTESLGIVFECMLDPSCNPADTQPKQVADEDGAPNEAENEDTDTRQREALAALAERFPNTPADKLVADYALASEKGIQRYVFEKVLTKIGLGAVASQAADAIPFVGAITTASTIISFVDHAGPTLIKLTYTTNSASASQIFMMYRTYADEIHTGHVNGIEVGSMVNSLGPGNQGPPSDPIKGGTASAEATPLYENMFGGSDAPKTALLNGVLPSAFAASSSNKANEYICEDGQPVPAGKLVCQEEVLGQGAAVLNKGHDFLHLPFISPITSAANSVTGITAKIGAVLGDIIKFFPFLNFVTDKATGLVNEVIKPFYEAAIGLIPNPFGSNMSGGRKFDMMAAGADVSGNDYAHVGLGGQKLSDQQVADIVNEHRSQEEAAFAKQSLFARMFNTDSHYSLVSKVAMSIPFGQQAAAQSGLASMLNPLGALSHSFGSIFSGKVSAALPPQPDPFGVTQYGYPDGSIPEDPGAYWDAHCSDKADQAYQNDADFAAAPGGKGWTGQSAATTPDDQNGMPVNTTVNPCLLIKAAVGSAGGLYDSSNLTAFDLADQQSAAASSTSAAISGDARQLAQQILDNNKISKTGRYVMEDLQNTAAGKPAYDNVTIALNILQFLAELGETTPYTITSITGAGCGHDITNGVSVCVNQGGNSNHYFGKAVDFGCGFDESKADEVAKKYGLMAQNERCDGGTDHSHFSKDGY